jgi:CTP synthase
LKEGTVAARAYDNQELIQERHRHRFEFNNQYRAEMEAKGLVFSGTSPDNHLVEVIEIPDKRFFVASQYHPEFLSRPQRPEGLFKAFIAAANQSK